MPHNIELKNEPSTDWVRHENIAVMEEALRWAHAQNSIYPILINGMPYESHTQAIIASTNPADPHETIGTVRNADGDHELINLAGKIATDAMPVLKEARLRKRWLLQAAQILRDRKFHIAALSILEAGKPWQEALTEVDELIDFCSCYAEAMTINLATQHNQPWLQGEENYTCLMPRGPTVAICPFNFPVSLLGEKIAASIAAGCPVLVKPAPQTPIVGYHVVQCFLAAGVPPAAISYLPGGAEAGKALVQSPYITQICFTGSQTTGQWIKEAALRSRSVLGSKRVSDELGSNNPLILCPTADLDSAIPIIIDSAYSYSGQKCSSLQRLIIVGDRQDAQIQKFLARLSEAVHSLLMGPPENPEFSYGPLISKEALQEKKVLVAALAEHAAEKLIADAPTVNNGFFLGPALFYGVPHDLPEARKEAFAPILLVFFVPTLEAAVALANDADYDLLTGGILTSRKAEIEYFLQNIRVGNAYVERNITGAIVGRQPFGHTSKVGDTDNERLLFFLRKMAISHRHVRHGTLLS